MNPRTEDRRGSSLSSQCRGSDFTLLFKSETLPFQHVEEEFLKRVCEEVVGGGNKWVLEDSRKSHDGPYRRGPLLNSLTKRY